MRASDSSYPNKAHTYLVHEKSVSPFLLHISLIWFGVTSLFRDELYRIHDGVAIRTCVAHHDLCVGSELVFAQRDE